MFSHQTIVILAPLIVHTSSVYEHLPARGPNVALEKKNTKLFSKQSKTVTDKFPQKQYDIDHNINNRTNLEQIFLCRNENRWVGCLLPCVDGTRCLNKKNQVDKNHVGLL